MSVSLTRGAEFEITPDGAADSGDAVGRVEGLVVFVRGGVPGDRLRARVVRTKKNLAEAEITAVLAPSPDRVTPRCRYFGVCGGCRWQHVRYEAQTALKRRQVVDALERIGGFRGAPVRGTLPSPSAYHYRNKMEFSFGTRWLTAEELKAAEPAGRFGLGLHLPKRFDRVLDLEECWLLPERSHAIVNAVRAFCLRRGLSVYSTAAHTGYLRNLVLREGANTGEVMVNLVTFDERPALLRELAAMLTEDFPFITAVVNNITERKSQVAVGDRETVLYGPGVITDRIGGNVFRISANSFFQTNTRQAERLYDAVREMARLRPDDIVFDLYSGTGTIALHLAGAVRRVVGIESAAAAVADAHANAARNGGTNCTFVVGDLRERLTRDSDWMAGVPRPTVVVTDPPRSGMHERVVQEIAALAPERIVYVSCNPATQARDLALLCAGGRYRLREVLPVDMFPQTTHVESVAALERTGPGGV